MASFAGISPSWARASRAARALSATSVPEDAALTKRITVTPLLCESTCAHDDSRIGRASAPPPARSRLHPKLSLDVRDIVERPSRGELDPRSRNRYRMVGAPRGVLNRRVVFPNS